MFHKNKIQQLLDELCPEGVEVKKLGEIVEIKRGDTITRKDVKDGDIPVLAGGREPAYYHNKYNREGETIVVAGSGVYAGYVTWWDKPIFVSDAFSIKSKEGLNLKYCYYWLKHNQIKLHNMKTGSGVPHVYPKNFEILEIPLPPIAVQEEIVRILDAYTPLVEELEAALKKELELRIKQYEYYREKLLTPIEQDGNWVLNGKPVEWKKLGDVCNIVSGGTPSKNNSTYWTNGTIKWLGSSVCQNIKGITQITDYITEEGLKKSSAKIVSKGSTLIALVGATIGKIAFLPFEAAINQNIAALYPNTNTLSNDFLYYACSMLYKEFYSSGQGKLHMANLSFIKNLLIPIPPLEEQERIVGILDKFETLVNDLKEGIPAEIELRKKQYEYYREKLLTFKIKETN